MKYLKKLFKLFVDDKRLAIGILLSIVLTKVLLWIGLGTIVAGLVLLILLVATLGYSVLKH